MSKELKTELRETLRARPGPNTAVAEKVTNAIFSWMSVRLPGTVVGYLAMADEVDVAGLFERLPGWRWLLPRVEPDGSLTLRDRAVAQERHRWGMAQPADIGPRIPVAEVDMVLVPGIGFTLRGERLGRGGGYYDRLLAGVRPDCVSLGVSWKDRVLSALPTEAHDARVSYVVTEDGVIEAELV